MGLGLIYIQMAITSKFHIRVRDNADHVLRCEKDKFGESDFVNHTFSLCREDYDATHTGHVAMGAPKVQFCANGVSVVLQSLTQTSLTH